MPGLDFSYSETVGALFEIVRNNGIDAEFVPEADRLALELLRETQGREFERRPELSPEGAVDEIQAPESLESAREGEDPAESDEDREKRRKRYVQPLSPPPADPEEPGQQ